MSAGQRILAISPPFDLARTTAPVWWAQGRWPGADWLSDRLIWVGWEGDAAVWRSVGQVEAETLVITGTGREELDRAWSEQVLGVGDRPPLFADALLYDVEKRHLGMGQWSAGSLYEGFVSSIVGQSVSVASAAVTERRLCQLFHPGLEIAGRRFWPVPRPEQLAAADPEIIRTSGVTMVRAEALVAIGRFFSGKAAETLEPRERAEQLLPVRGVGRWTIESALLWGIGYPDAHPSGDVALLRAVRRHRPEVTTLRDLDRVAEDWRPYRAWAARLFWLDLLGFAGQEHPPPVPRTTYP